MPYYPPASSGSGTVDSVVAGNNIDVDATDPANPIVAVETLTLADISDVTASVTEVNYTDGVTSAIQTQLNTKVDTANSPNANEFARFTDADTIEGRTTAETKTDLSLNNVDNTSDATKNAAAVTLTNKTIDGDDNTITDLGTSSYKDASVTSAKLAEPFFRGRFQNNTTDSVATGRTVQYGFGWIDGSVAAVITETVTFDDAFSSVDNILVTFNGTKASDPSGITDSLAQASRVYAHAYNASTSGFTIGMRNNDSSNFGSGTRYAYSWQAIGTI